MVHRRLLAPLFAGLALLALALPAQAAHVQCGAVITSDTTLDSDLVGCPQDGIVIAAGDVTLDFNDHTVSGTGTGAGVRGAAGPPLANVLIRGRGTVRAFNVGIDLSTLPDSTVQGLTVRQNRSPGIRANQSFGHVISDNQVRDNGFEGIELSDAENGSRATHIEHNTIRGNGGGGVRLTFSGAQLVGNDIVGNGFSGVVVFSTRVDAMHNAIKRNDSNGITATNFATGQIVSNVITWNGRDGIELENSADPEAISDNTIKRNARNGISVQVAGNETPIARNQVTHNAVDGIFVSLGAMSTVISANQSNRNGDDGIDTDDPETTLSGNRANHNFDLGIEAVAGVTDGGGNRAKHNGNPLQCVNVACTN